MRNTIKTEYKMKKNFISTVALLLCGAIFFGSCEDLLEAESNRVEYEFEDFTSGDLVYSVLGILNAVQKVGDKQILLGELRGDLVTTNSHSAKELNDISNFEFDAESNKYLNPKEYYEIINNCNVYLARVDTNLSNQNRELVKREYAAVKSVRAWTYIQLMKNYKEIPFYTDPLTSNSQADEIMTNNFTDQLGVINYLIEDLEPFQTRQMPEWEIKDFSAPNVTKKLFMPIRVLLGDLYLWRAALLAETAAYPLPMANPNSDYAKAAMCYYQYLAIDNKISDNNSISEHKNEKPNDNPNYVPSINFADRYAMNNFDNNLNNFVSVIRYSKTEELGNISHLASIFAPGGEENVGTAQVVAAPAIYAVSTRQAYLYRYGDTKQYQTYIESSKFPGDLRVYSTVVGQRDADAAYHSNMIVKYNLDESKSISFDNGQAMYYPGINTITRTIILDRPEYVYLRFAEALLGLEREGYTGAKELAMSVLKDGIRGDCQLYWNPVYGEKYMEDEKTGEYLMAPLKDGGKNIVLEIDGEEVAQYAPVVYENAVLDFDSKISYDFSNTTFSSNIGIHSRGSGFSAYNKAYALTDSCVALHFNIEPREEMLTRPVLNADGSKKQIPLKDETGAYILDENGNVAWEFEYEEALVEVYDVTDEHRMKFMYDKLIDEMALEMAFEGHRFADLSRIAISLGNYEFLARRIAARNVATGDWRSAEGADGWDSDLFNRLKNKDSWYLPLPAYTK